MSQSLIQASLISAVAAALPLLFAGLGELLSEKVGVMNIGIEGVMLVGAVAGFAVTFSSGNIALGLLSGAGAGAVFAAVLVGIPAVLLGSPQILVGFAAWFIGAGLASQLGTRFVGESIRVEAARTNVPLLDQLPFVGDIFFRQTWPVYFALGVAVAISLLLSFTRYGLNLRSVGEDPSSAYAAGVPVRAIQMTGVSFGGALMGLGGAVLSVVITGVFQSGITSGRGFIAFALVIFVGWRPIVLAGAAYLFGILLILVNVGQSEGWGIPPSFLLMIPYLLTVTALALRASREMRRRARPAAPAALGSAFVRGDK